MKDEKALSQTWNRFIHTHHYQIEREYFNSLIANHPRRTCEVLWKSLMEVRIPKGNPVLKTSSLEELWDWFKPLLEAETREIV